MRIKAGVILLFFSNPKTDAKTFWLYSGSGLTDDEQHERPIAYYLFYQKIACESPNLSIFLCDMAF